jgi:hypothetical protein
MASVGAGISRWLCCQAKAEQADQRDVRDPAAKQPEVAFGRGHCCSRALSVTSATFLKPAAFTSPTTAITRP